MAPEFTLDPPDAGSLTGTTTSIGDDAPHSGQQSGGGGGVTPGEWYLASGLNPGQPLNRKWLAGKPLLMMFDRATANDAITGDYLPADAGDATAVQQRNAVISTGTLTNLTPARKNFPSDRSFNAVCLTIGQLTESSSVSDPGSPPAPLLLDDLPAVVAHTKFAQPRPGHEPDSTAPDPIPGNSPTDVLTASRAVRRYCRHNMEASTATRLYAPIPERDLLFAHTEGIRLSGREDWWNANLSTEDRDHIFQHVDNYVKTCLQDDVISDFIAGFFILDEPDIPRRLPTGVPEVVGLVAGKVVADQSCAFRVVATNRPTQWTWEFFLDDLPIVPTPPESASTFEPVVRFPNAGRGKVIVRCGNWRGVGSEVQFRFDVVGDLADPATPVITGLYSRTSDGIIHGVAKPKADDDPEPDPDGPDASILSWNPGGSFFEETDENGQPTGVVVGQDGDYGVCAVHQSGTVISSFQGVLDEAGFWPTDWRVPHGRPVQAFSHRELTGVNFPKFDQEDPDVAEATQTNDGCSVTLLPTTTSSVKQKFSLEITRRRLQPFPSWIRPALIQRVADRLHSKISAWWLQDRPIRLFLNFNGGIVEERFREQATLPLGSRKLTSFANFDLSDRLPNRGTRHLNENTAEFPHLPQTPNPEAAVRQQFVTDFPDGTPPAAAMRLNRSLESVRQVLYSVDDYPVVLDTTQLLTNFKRSIGQPGMSDGDALIQVRKDVAIRDVNHANHNYGRFRADLAQRKPTGEPSITQPRRSIVWVQMWGYPQRHNGLNGLSYSLGSFADLPKDPQSPAANDGWELRKPTEFEARIQVWLPIFMGAEGIGWFAQFFCADALIYLLYDKLAGEIARYEDFRHNSWLLSSDQGAGEVDGRGVLGWKDISAALRRDAHGNARELVNVGGASPKEPEGRVELDLMVMLLERRTTLSSPTRLAGKQFLFLANPSWRTRRVELDFSAVANLNPSGEGWQLYQYGTAVTSLSGISLPKPLGTVATTDTAFKLSMTEASTGVILPLLANEVRIYERQVLS